MLFVHPDVESQSKLSDLIQTHKREHEKCYSLTYSLPSASLGSGGGVSGASKPSDPVLNFVPLYTHLASLRRLATWVSFRRPVRDLALILDSQPR